MSVVKSIRLREQAVIDSIESTDSPFTTLQIWNLARKSIPGISRATVYRILTKLRVEGLIKDIILPNGLHVSIYTEEDTYCIMECEDCGRFSMSPELSARLADATLEIPILPSQTAIYLRGRCRKMLMTGQCCHRLQAVDI